MLLSELEKVKNSLNAQVQDRGFLGVVAFGRTPGQDPKLAVRLRGTKVMPPEVRQFIDEVALAEIGRKLTAEDMDVAFHGIIKAQGDDGGEKKVASR